MGLNVHRDHSLSGTGEGGGGWGGGGEVGSQALRPGGDSVASPSFPISWDLSPPCTSSGTDNSALNKLTKLAHEGAH